MHVREAELVALFDGELDAAAARSLRDHLARCSSCAARSRGIEALLDANRDALEALDAGTAPAVSVDELIERARLAAPIPRERGRPQGRPRLQRAAAVAFLVVAAAAAAATIPDSPVRDAASGLLERFRAEPPPTAEGGEAAVAFEPAARLVVAFAERQERGAIVIVLAPGPTARVGARDGTARFSVGTDSVAVDNRGSAANYVVTVPDDLADVLVRVGQTTVFRRSGADIHSLEPVRSGHTTIPFASVR